MSSTNDMTALSIIELLELILKHLDLIDLAKARQVCRTWKDTIQGSKALRRDLFLEAAPEQNGAIWDGVLHEGEQATSLATSGSVGIGSRRITIAFVHSFFRYDKTAKARRFGLTLEIPELSQTLSLPRDGELMRMFLTQPPCTTFGLYSSRVGTYKVIEDMNGVRIGLVAETLRTVVEERRKHEDAEKFIQARAFISVNNFLAHDSHWVLTAGDSSHSADCTCAKQVVGDRNRECRA